MRQKMSMEDPRHSVTPSLPHLRYLVDLHIYLVPLDCWLSYQKLARNHVMDEAISLGFIRVQSQLTLHDLRKELEDRLDKELLPRTLVFLKSVGRNFTEVKSRQEFQLKVRDYVPPYALEPELYILQSPPLCPWERLAYSKTHSGMSNRMFSSSANRYSLTRRGAHYRGRDPRFPEKTSFPALQTESTNVVSTSSGAAVKNATTVLPPVQTAKANNAKRSRLPVKSALAPTHMSAKEGPRNNTPKTVKFPKINSTESSAVTPTRNETRIPKRTTPQKQQKTVKMTTSHGSAVYRSGRRVSLVANVLKSKHAYYNYRVRPNSHAKRVYYPSYYARHPPYRYRYMSHAEDRLTRSAIYRMRHANCFVSDNIPSAKRQNYLNQWRPKPKLFRSRSMLGSKQVRMKRTRTDQSGKSFLVLEQSNHLNKINEEPHKNPEEISLSMMSSEGTPVLSKKTARKIYQAKSAGRLEVSNPKNYSGQRNGDKENMPTTSSSTKTNTSIDRYTPVKNSTANNTIVYGSDLDRYMYSIHELRRIRHTKCFVSEAEPRSVTNKRKPLVAKVTFKPRTLYKGVVKDVKFDVADETKRIQRNLDLSPIKVPAPSTPSPSKVNRLSSASDEPVTIRKRRPRVFKQRRDGGLKEVTRRDYASQVNSVGTGVVVEKITEGVEESGKTEKGILAEKTIVLKRSPVSSAELKISLKEIKPDTARRVTMVGAGNHSNGSNAEKTDEVEQPASKEEKEAETTASKTEALLTLPRIDSNKKVARVSPEPANVPVKPISTAGVSEPKVESKNTKENNTASQEPRSSSSQIPRLPKVTPERSTRSGIPVRIKSSQVAVARKTNLEKGELAKGKVKTVPASASGKLSKGGLHRPDMAVLVTPVGAGNPNTLKQVKKGKAKPGDKDGSRIKPTIMVSGPSPDGLRPLSQQTPKKAGEVKEQLKLPQIKNKKKRMAAGADKKIEQVSWTVDIEVQECLEAVNKSTEQNNNDESFVVTADVRVASASCRGEQDCCIDGIKHPRTILLCSVDRPRSF